MYVCVMSSHRLLPPASRVLLTIKEGEKSESPFLLLNYSHINLFSGFYLEAPSEKFTTPRELSPSPRAGVADLPPSCRFIASKGLFLWMCGAAVISKPRKTISSECI